VIVEELQAGASAARLVEAIAKPLRETLPAAHHHHH
jgi:hypothetical protein